MMVTGTDLIVADQSRSAQGRVHFINAVRNPEGFLAGYRALTETQGKGGMSRRCLRIEWYLLCFWKFVLPALSMLCISLHFLWK